MGFRLLDYVVVAVPIALHPRWLVGHSLSHMVWLPLPGVQSQVARWLALDVSVGLTNIDQLQRYALQFIPVVQAINHWLARIPSNDLLNAVDQLANQPFDWRIVRYGSASIRAALWQTVIDGLVIVPERWRQRWQARFNSEPRLDTLPHAACAGYWYLHTGEVDKACDALEQVRKIRGGEVLYLSVVTLLGSMVCKSLSAIAKWSEALHWLSEPHEDVLRPQTVATLNRLRNVALEARVAIDSISKLNRSAALGRAIAVLTQLLADVKDTCPYPERPAVRAIAESWRDILSLAAGEIGTFVIDKPIANPFIVGNPVQGQSFVGRDEVFQHLEELWETDSGKSVPSVVLYGHRRMGKSSILQNLGHRFGVQTVVAYFTMQRVGRATTGELLGNLALVIYDALQAAGLNNLVEPQLDEFEHNSYTAFNQFLRSVRATIGSRRVILTIDEFEAIEDQIASGRVEAELLAYLRGIVQSEPWLILALAGLHTLKEMTADYWNPLYSSVTPVHVGLLTRAETAQLLANPSDDFPLDLTGAIERVYDLVHGQPYLTQLIGHSLVRLYNRSVFEEQKPRAQNFTAEDVEAIVNAPEFYEQGNYYFSGVWHQAEASGPNGQTALLQVLARSNAPLTVIQLFEQARLTAEVGHQSLDKLIQHDVITAVEPDTYDFTVPLMRRWIRLNHGDI